MHEPPAESEHETEQALAVRVVSAMLAKDVFSQWLGIELVEVRPGAVRVRMRVRADMLNGFGVCHGAVTFAVADTALAFASNTHGYVTVSIENSIGYPAAVRAGDELMAAAEEESSTTRLAFYRVAVTKQTGERVALFRGTVYKTKTPFLSDTE